ncbi:Protein of unknown function [Arsukibacterium tuosuense]|uniref:DUF3592 domain-containing protein n=1 Tax=Arsukibacterium tuosuense TaxID=1323745 RepID=A0A285I5A4_9GAMM|nr:DUF3592 domain-containing protein [Arsukibacterium tuosuense]SNY43129.1 Protein of unknown function [Arsukibacterium tuosuense]
MNLPLMAGVAFLLFGIYLLKHAISRYKKAKMSRHWPVVDGRLTEVKLWGPRLVDGKTTDAEKLNVAYSYVVDGTAHSGRRASFYTMVYPETLDFARRHAVGSDIAVYYNPRNPADAVIITGLKKDKPYSDVILGVLAVVIGAVIAVLAWFNVIG